LSVRVYAEAKESFQHEDGPKNHGQRLFSKVVEPCLPTLTQVIPGGPDWLHEIKYETNMIEQHNLLNRAAGLSTMASCAIQ
jgi:hypothetical protein